MAILSRFLEPPRLRTYDEEQDRHATWLELFFDLVFVVAVAEVGHNLSDDVTFQGLLEFVAIFVPVWWAWAGFTFYANRFDTDDLAYRLLSLAGMFAVAVLATNVHRAFDGGASEFTVSYVLVRLVILALYARAIPHVPQARALASLYFAAFSAAVVVWLLSVTLPEPDRYWLWALALAFELGAPLVGWRLIPRAPIHPAHIPERFGLLTIIVLGESVIAVVLGVADTRWDLESGAAALGGFVCAAALWWIYFEFLDESMVRRGVVRGLVFTYSHFPVVVGLAGLGIGVKVAILAAGGDGKYAEAGWLVCAGVAFCMLGQAAIHLATPPTLFDLDVWLRLATAALALALVPFSDLLPPLAIVWLLAGALVAQVAYELAGQEHHDAAGEPATRSLT